MERCFAGCVMTAVLAGAVGCGPVVFTDDPDGGGNSPDAPTLVELVVTKVGDGCAGSA